MIVGGNDREVLRLNRAALADLRCEKELSIVAGATHLFSEFGALDEVAKRATDWYLERLDGSKAGAQAIAHATD